MTPTSRREYAHVVRQRYAQASRTAKSQILTEFCATTRYHRKYAITLLTTPPAPCPRGRRVTATLQRKRERVSCQRGRV